MNEIPSPQAGTYQVRVTGATVYVLNVDGVNRWMAQVQPGFDDNDERVSDGECQVIARRIGAALNAAAPTEQTVNRATVIDWLDALGIEVTDRQLAGLFHAAPGAAAAAPAITWPKARDVGRLGDMSPDAHIRVGLDSDNDVFVSVWDGQRGGSVEFCNGGGGGGQSMRTRLALIALMVAIEADNAEKPRFDWWAVRNGQQGAKA